MKKITAMLLCIVMLFSFAGCNSKEKTSDKVFYDPSNDKVVNLGVIAPFSGDLKLIGKEFKKGTELALKEINKKGGVMKKKLGILYEDDKGGTKSKKAYNAIRANCSCVITATTTTSTLNIAELSAEDMVMTVSAAASHYDVTYEKVNSFRTCDDSTDEALKIAEYIYATLNCNTVSVITNNEMDSHSDEMYGEFVKAIDKDEMLELQTLDGESYDEGETDFTDIAINVIAQAPECVFIPDYYPNAYSIIVALRDAGYQGPIVGSDAWTGIYDYAEDVSYLENCHYPTYYYANGENDTAKAFEDAYYKEYGEAPSSYATQGYDTVKMVVQGMKDQKSFLTKHIMAAWTEISYIGITGRMTPDSTGNIEKGIRFVAVDKGSLIHKLTLYIAKEVTDDDTSGAN